VPEVGRVSDPSSQPCHGQDPWEVWIFGGPTGLQFLGSVAGQTNRLVTFSSAGPAIHMFKVFNGVPTQGTDNLTFDAAMAATPEPASVLLLVSGLAGTLLRRRRNRRVA
jgi:PEP-CTERM motif